MGSYPSRPSSSQVRTISSAKSAIKNLVNNNNNNNSKSTHSEVPEVNEEAMPNAVAATPDAAEEKEQKQDATSVMTKSHTGIGADIPDWYLEILSFLPAREAMQVLCSVREWHDLLFGPKPDAAMWKWCSEKFAHDHLLFCPEGVRAGKRCNIDWRLYFNGLVAIRDLWSDGADTTGTRKATAYDVQVAVRFRPSAQNSRTFHENKMEDDKVFLPLHQRIQLIKANRKLETSAEAFQVLKAEGNLFKHGKLASNNNNEEEEEHNNNHGRFTPKVQAILPDDAQVVVLAPSIGLREFTFDSVLDVEVQQHEVYETVTDGGRLVADFLNGFNATILVYGQTGSGKTHTMFGPSGVGAETGAHLNLMGVIPRVCAHCFESIGARNGQSNGPSKRIKASLFVSFIEVYGEQVNDLLKGGSPVSHSQVAAARFVMDGAAEVPVTSAQDLLAVLETGEQHKRTAATRMNERSTRAHSIVVLKLVQERVDDGLTIQSQFYLADLGGSEQLKKSLLPSTSAAEKEKSNNVGTADGTTSPGSSVGSGASIEDNEAVLREKREAVELEQADRKREAVQINMGLLALKRVITALKEKRKHIPYQDSKLTMLLSSGLGGDSKTTVVVCGSLEPEHMSETLATLRFGEECASVRTRVRKGVAVIASLVEEVDARIAVLGGLIRTKEKWVNKKVVRVDENFEAGTLEATLGGEEHVMTSVLEGAEKERKELEMLVIRRAELVGDDVETSLLEAGFKGFGRFAAGAIGTDRVTVGGMDTSDSRFMGGEDVIDARI